MLGLGAKAGAMELDEKIKAAWVLVAARSGKQNPTQKTRWGPCPISTERKALDSSFNATCFAGVEIEISANFR